MCVLMRQVSFYPRAREGRDQIASELTLAGKVSIRAPVKDATWEGIVLAKYIVSIRAPVKDATNTKRAQTARLSRFYPRAREGRD